MRILFLDHPQFTSGTFMLWHGLKELQRDGFPVEPVLYPHIPTHFESNGFNIRAMDWYRDLEKVVAAGELPWGIPAFAPGEQLTYDGQDEIRRYSPAQKFVPPAPIPTEATVVQALKEGQYNLVVLGNSHRVPTILLGRLKERVGATRMPPLVYYDAGERDEFCEHWIHVFRPQMTFKQILTPEIEAKGLSIPTPGYTFKPMPLPLSSILIDYPDTRIGGYGLTIKEMQTLDRSDLKFLEVYYHMGITWPERQDVMNALDAYVASRKLNWVGATTYPNYHLMLSRSRMGVSMRGSGRDTLRYWEIPLYKTAMLVDGTMGCIHPYPYEDEKTAIFWKNPKDLIHKVGQYIMGGPKEGVLRQIAEAGQCHLKRYHSTKARAAFFINRVVEELKIGEQIQHEDMTSRPWRGPVA